MVENTNRDRQPHPAISLVIGYSIERGLIARIDRVGKKLVKSKLYQS